MMIMKRIKRLIEIISELLVPKILVPIKVPVRTQGKHRHR